MNLAVIGRFSVYAAGVELRRSMIGGRIGILLESLALLLVTAALGTLFGTIFKQNIESYQDYIKSLGAGLIAWIYLSSAINRSCTSISAWSRILRHARVPVAAIPLATLLRSGTVLFLNLILFQIATALLTDSDPLLPISFLFGLALLTANLYCFSFVATLLCLRFRNLPQSISGLLQVGFFLTPLVWPDFFLGRYQFLNEINPFYHLVELIRSPLLGRPIPLLGWAYCVATLIVAALLGLAMNRVSTRRLAYWL
ncbi:MAG: hypothetical protein GC191_19895 [Azospirillum sp.]|nr:hypothetical protein [Azospirillum sp.]